MPNQISVQDTWSKPILSALLLRREPMPPRCIIAYRNSNYCVQESNRSPNIPSSRVEHAPSSLLGALQLIRDQLDAVLLLPPTQRDKEVQRLAARVSLDEDHVRRLAAWFPQIEPRLSAEQEAQ